MSRWWRAHDEAVDNPKLCLLPDKAHRAWFNLMCVASANGGMLPDMKVLALKLRMPPAKVELVLSTLIEARLFDRDEAGVRPHNWQSRQFKSDVTDPTNADRQHRYRNRKRNGQPAVTETVTPNVIAKRPETDTEAKTEKKEDAAGAAPDELERQLFDRGKQVLGKDAGGLIAKLFKAKQRNVALARAAIEQAATKQKPREYIGAVIAGGEPTGDGKRLTNDEAYWGVGRIPGII